MINMISSGNIKKDYEDFLNVLISKYKIKNREEFEKDFLEFLSRVIKPEHKNIEEAAKSIKKNPEQIPEISKEFFSLIEKHSDGFDFYEGASEEINLLKEKVRNNG